MARPVGPRLGRVWAVEIFSSGSEITLSVDVRAQLDTKRASLAAHASQAGEGVRTVRLLLALPRPLAARVLGTEWFVEVA